MAKGKWLISAPEEEREYVRVMAEELSVSQGLIVGEMIAREMRNKNSTLRTDIKETKLKAELQKLNDAEMEIQLRRQELTKQMKTGRVLQTA